MDNVQKPSNSKCYTPSSEPFRTKFELFQQNSTITGTNFKHDLEQWIRMGNIVQQLCKSVYLMMEV
jgi:hypothetical protein